MNGNAPHAAVRSAYLWGYLGHAGSLAVILATDAVRGRLYRASELGAFVTGMWLLGLTQLIGDAGVGAVIISRPSMPDGQITALRRVAVGLAIAATLVVLLGAAPLAWWTGERAVAWVAAGFAPAALLYGLTSVPQSLVVRRLDFRAVARAETLGNLVQLVATTVLGLLIRGPAALVVAIDLGALVRFVVLSRAAAWPRGVASDRSEMREHLRDATHITGSRVLSYGYMNADYFVLSRWGGLGTLAAYYNAFRLATLPSQLVTKVLQQVSFSAFASAASDPVRLRETYLSSLRLAATLVFPVSLGLVAIADVVIPVLYGPGWDASIDVLRILAVLGLVRSLQVIAPSVLLARGRARTNVVISLVYFGAVVPAFLFGIRYGALGIAVAWVAVAVPIDIVVSWLGLRASGAGTREALNVVGGPALRATVMALVVFAFVTLALPGPKATFGTAHRVAVLLAAIGLGGLIYGGWTFWADVSVRELVRSVRSRAVSK